MLRQNLPVATTLVLLCSACRPVPPPELTAADKASIAEALEERVSGYAEAARRRDVDYMLGFWADVDEFVIAGDGELTVGYDAWADFIRQSIVEFPVVNSITTRNPHVYVIGLDAASYTVEFEWSMTSAEGETTSARGTWTYVFRHLDGEWRVVHSAGTHLYS